MIVGVIGSTGFVGQNLIKQLQKDGIRYYATSRRKGVDARSAIVVSNWITSNKITHVINLAADCGGIGLNQKRPADLWAATCQISTGVLGAARQSGLKKLIMVGTVCSYARDCPVPFKESDLMSHGEPEETNRAYGLAKLSALYGATAYAQQYKLNVTNLIPVNMYGPYDHFDLENSHVIPALIRKVDEARVTDSPLQVWGTGSATREFLFARDFAKAAILALDKNTGADFINIGTGAEISIRNLVVLLCNIMDFKGEVIWDSTKPDGQPRRCLDTSKAKQILGFKAETSIEHGLEETVEWWRSQEL